MAELEYTQRDRRRVEDMRVTVTERIERPENDCGYVMRCVKCVKWIMLSSIRLKNSRRE